MGLLGISLKDSSSYLYKAAARCVDRIVEWAQNSQAAASAGTAFIPSRVNSSSLPNCPAASVSRRLVCTAELVVVFQENEC